jgi:hypothetical protein
MKKAKTSTDMRSYLDGNCEGVTNYPPAEHFEPPANGSFYTYVEILQNLDDMHSLYGDLITERANISNSLHTLENREIFWVRISDNAASNEEEPEVLYTALTHGNEPATAVSLIYFMWYLLENYEDPDADPLIRNLVNERELYFIPLLNPDGYLFGGGAEHRKNMRETCAGSSDGVDINRNFGYQYGPPGSSDVACNGTYRGSGEFSEQETQMLREFVINHQFTTALHGHAQPQSENELYHPWEHVAPPPEPLYDAAEYYRLSDVIAWDSRYHFGQANTLSYTNGVNGGVNNWFYGDLDDKTYRIFSWLTEIGSDAGDLADICQEQGEVLFKVAQVAGPTVAVHQLDPSTLLPGQVNSKHFTVENLGLQASQLNVQAHSLHQGVSIQLSGSPITFLNPLETQDILLDISVAANIPNGSIVRFVIDIDGDNLVYQPREYSMVVRHVPIYINETGFADWTSPANGWGTVGDWITDSPTGLQISPFNPCTLNTVIYLSSVAWARVTFLTHWSIRTWDDYVQLEVKVGNGQWSPLCGNYTKPGAASFSNQPASEQLYDGRQLFPVREEIDISQFAGDPNNPGIQFRFVAVADNGGTGDPEDGFYFTDFSIYGGNTCGDGIQNNSEENIDCGGPCIACPTCIDEVQNQGEEGVDCGGPCITACPTCDDEIQNQGEEGVDCGGPCITVCPTCYDEIQNQGEEGVDCGYPCAPCHCFDGVQNGTETGVDCGKPCPPCAPSCTDGIQNQGETGVDCGGPCLIACPNCFDHILNQGEQTVDCGGPCPVCTCNDGIQNQGEGGIDCGGPCPRTCPYENCHFDGIQNYGETGIDCGGFNCPPCLIGGGGKIYYNYQNTLITIAPNPALDEIVIKVDAPDIPQEIKHLIKYTIFTSTGIGLSEGELNVNSQINLDLAHLPAGLFFVQFRSEEGFLQMRRFIKQ